MSVVLDASALVAALTDAGPEGQWARSVIADGDLHAPELILAETTNILRRHELAGQIASAEANSAHADLMRLALFLVGFAPFAERIWELRHNVTSYDGWYIAVAEGFALPLATLDGRLARTKGVRCKFLTP